MNKTKFVLVGCIMMISTAVRADVLTGLPKLACEAILCLSTGSPPGECSPSLNYYFDIHFKDWDDTLDARTDFLNLCPASSQTPQMQSLVQAIANGAGRCDAASLNATLVGNPLTGSCISSKLPTYCSDYENHGYTRLKTLTYVPLPKGTSYWPFTGLGTSPLSSGIAGYGRTQPACGKWVEN